MNSRGNGKTLARKRENVSVSCTDIERTTSVLIQIFPQQVNRNEAQKYIFVAFAHTDDLKLIIILSLYFKFRKKSLKPGRDHQQGKRLDPSIKPNLQILQTSNQREKTTYQSILRKIVYRDEDIAIQLVNMVISKKFRLVCKSICDLRLYE